MDCIDDPSRVPQFCVRCQLALWEVSCFDPAGNVYLDNLIEGHKMPESMLLVSFSRFSITLHYLLGSDC